MVDGRGPFHSELSVPVDTEQEAQAAIDRFASLGYTQVKIYNSIKPRSSP